MQRDKGQGHEQPATPPIDIIWHNTVPSASQIRIWDLLWQKLLLGHTDPETRQPQAVEPGATTATVASGTPLLSKQANDSRCQE